MPYPSPINHYKIFYGIHNNDLNGLKWQLIVEKATLDISYSYGTEYTFYMLVPRLNTDYLIPPVFFQDDWKGDFASTVFFASNNYVAARVAIDGINHRVSVSAINQTGSILTNFDLYGCNL